MFGGWPPGRRRDKAACCVHPPNRGGIIFRIFNDNGASNAITFFDGYNNVLLTCLISLGSKCCCRCSRTTPVGEGDVCCVLCGVVYWGVCCVLCDV